MSIFIRAKVEIYVPVYMHVFEDEKLETLWDEITFDVNKYAKKTNRIDWKVQSDVLPAEGWLVITNPKAPDAEGIVYSYKFPTMRLPDWSPGLLFKPSQLGAETKAKWEELQLLAQISWKTAAGQTLTLTCQKHPLDPTMCNMVGDMYVYKPFLLSLAAPAAKAISALAEIGCTPLPK